MTIGGTPATIALNQHHRMGKPVAPAQKVGGCRILLFSQVRRHSLPDIPPLRTTEAEIDKPLALARKHKHPHRFHLLWQAVYLLQHRFTGQPVATGFPQKLILFQLVHFRRHDH